jgi:fatty acid desaturase
MFNSETMSGTESGSAAISLTDTELDQVTGGFLVALAGIAAGVVLGAAAFVVVAAAADYISHDTGHGCIFK